MSRATDEINKVTGTVIGLSWKLIVIAVVILLLIEGATHGYRFGYEVFAAEPMESAPGKDITFSVASGESDLDVLKDMNELGLIRDAYATLISAIFFDYTIYPGTYTLNTSMTPREMLEEMNVRPEGYVEPTVAETEAETEALPVVAPAATEEVYYDEEPSEMVWEAVEAEVEPEPPEEDVVTIDEEDQGEAADDVIEIRID